MFTALTRTGWSLRHLVCLGPDRLAQSRRPAGISHTAKRLTAAITLASSPMGSPPPQRGSGRGVAAPFRGRRACREGTRLLEPPL